ncbi:hypothetical protein B0H66DRAFT_617843 [Apodospora peruviana]|uniref:Ankyrin repeat protein n=1 Tax=Apodospora peruviana TaxID=516989 RepID=A0AAE0IK69_9PEZI|nr:hypothetical protein B0H66DRAFT_617843 [Apodospora peruviana]
MATVLEELLANIETTFDEKHDLFVAAIKAVNLEAMAMILISNNGHRYRVLSVLLLAGAQADVPVLRNRLLEDTKAGNVDHVELLISFGVSPHHIDANALKLAIKNTRLDLCRILAHANIPEDAASQALSYIPGPNTAEADRLHLASLLGSKGATIKFDNGKTLVRIVERLDVPLLRVVLQGTQSQPPSQRTVDLAFKRLMACSTPGDVRLAMAEVIISQRASTEARSTHLLQIMRDQKALQHAVDEYYVAGVAVMVTHEIPEPQATSAFERLVDRNPWLDKVEVLQIATKLPSTRLLSVEKTDCQPGFTSAVRRTSAIHIAVKNGRLLVLLRLVELRVMIDLEDADGFTPPQPRDIRRQHRYHDCSARRQSQGQRRQSSHRRSPGQYDVHISPKTVRSRPALSIQASWHGRAPLAELCYGAQSSGPHFGRAVEASMRALAPLLDHRWKELHRRTVLYLAIENPTSAIAVLDAFLRVSNLCHHPGSDDDYIFVSTATGGYCYSPTKYTALIKLLKYHQFDDRYYAEADAMQRRTLCRGGRYAETDEQPARCVGLPRALREALLEEENTEHRQRQEIRRTREAAAAQARLEEQKHR